MTYAKETTNFGHLGEDWEVFLVAKTTNKINEKSHRKGVLGTFCSVEKDLSKSTQII